jgi:MFS transporter, PPP family, 3-phenylpropionic acid transporter
MRRRILPLRVFYFASFAALGAFAPFFPRWLAARGVQGLAMGAILATLPAMGFVGPPLVGVIADALGRHGRLLRITSVGAFLALVGLALVGGLGLHVTFLGLFAMVLAHAAFRSPMVVMADVVAIEQAPKAGVSYGRIRNWGSAGSLVGAIGVGHVVDPSSATALPAAVAVPLLFAVLATFALPDADENPRLPLRAEARALAASGDVPVFLCTALVSEFALSSYDVGFALRLGDIGASSAFIGGAWAVGVASEIVLMACAGWLIRRFTPPRLIVAALLVAALRCALLGTLRSLPILVAIQPLHALSIALWWISSVSYIKARVAPHALGSAQGLFAAVTAAGSVTGMLVWGTLYRVAGGQATFGIAGIVALCAAGLALIWTTRAHEVRQVV